MKSYQKLSLLFWVWKSKTDEEGRSPIYVRITIEGRRAQFSLGVKIKASLFNNKSGKARGSSPEASLVNNEINIASGRLRQYYNVLSIQHTFVTPEMLKQVYFGKNIPNKCLVQIITYHNKVFLEKVSAGNRSKATLKKYNATKEKVKAYLSVNMD